MRHFARLLFAIPVVLAASAAGASGNHYGLTISTATTHNVSFNNGVFTATGDGAVLNVTDLENALGNGDTEVTTDNGAGGDEKGDLHVDTALSWTRTSVLTLDAYHSIFVDQPVSVDGVGGMSVVTNDGGSEGFFSIGRNGRSKDTAGHITFTKLSSALSINGTVYTLIGSVASLAAAVAANPSGAYALAADYDASADGTYSSTPVSTTFSGNLDGLGNVISNLTIDASSYNVGGLFYDTQAPASVSHLALKKLNLADCCRYFLYQNYVGGLAVSNTGTLFEDSVAGWMTVQINAGGDNPCENCAIGGMIGSNGGQIDSSSTAVSIAYNGTHRGNPFVGGLVGLDEAIDSVETGAITNSRATGDITAQTIAVTGGLVGAIDGASIATSFATGNLSCIKRCDAGGLLGETRYQSSVANSYATGNIAEGAYIGGLVGLINQGALSVAASYSTGAPTGGTDSVVGGFVGYDGSSSGSLGDCYWDTDTSGITNPSQGAGYPSNDSGITAKTTKQLQSGLPKGFDSAIWAEKKTVNNGLPYLKANPPPK